MPSRRHRSAMLSSPRSPSSTMRIFSSGGELPSASPTDLYVDMVRHQMPLLDLAFFLLGQATHYVAQIRSNLPETRFLPILRDEYDVILTLPTTVI